MNSQVENYFTTPHEIILDKKSVACSSHFLASLLFSRVRWGLNLVHLSPSCPWGCSLPSLTPGCVTSKGGWGAVPWGVEAVLG